MTLKRTISLSFSLVLPAHITFSREGPGIRVLGMLNYVMGNLLHYPEQRIQLMNLYDGIPDLEPRRERAEKAQISGSEFERY